MGVSNGFVVPPLRLMHCDTLEVFANRPGGLASVEQRRQAEGVGLLLRTAVFAHGHRCGCTKAEILAINDDGEVMLCCALDASVSRTGSRRRTFAVYTGRWGSSGKQPSRASTEVALLVQPSTAP